MAIDTQKLDLMLAELRAASALAGAGKPAGNAAPAEGPDFAGHYKVVTWGCGAGCVQFAIVNVQTGDVHFPPEVETVMALPEREEDPVQRRTGSRLLVLTGRKVKPGWRAAEDGKFYYEWKDDRLVLLRKVKLQTKY